MTDARGRGPIFRFDVFEVDVSAHELRRAGVRIRLQEQPFQVLLLLLERAGHAVTRDELRQRIWQSSVYVDFDHGLNNAIARLREVLGDAPVTPQFIETVPRVGYRFLKPVAITPAGGIVTIAPALRRRWIVPAIAVAAGLLLAGLLLFLFANREGEEHAARAPAIAVLPFVSLSGNPEDEQFADGLTEELVNKLAGIRGLDVVARTSSFRYKGKSGPVTAIAAELRVDHLLEGSVRHANGRLRVTAQLIDAHADRHLWSQTFDREPRDIFAIQEEIAIAVADALKVSLLQSDEQRLRRHGTDDPEAYRLFLIAQSHLLARTSKPDAEVAKRSLEAAIERDPNFASAHAGLARYYFRRAWGTLVDTEDGARLGMAAAQRAVALDPQSSDARMAHANFEFWRYRFQGDYGAHLAAESDMQRAITLDPGNSVAYEEFGRAILWHEPERATSLLERATQVDLLCIGPNIMIASLRGNRGQLDAARKHCADLVARFPEAKACDMSIGTLELYYGNVGLAVPLLKIVEKFLGGPARIQLWSVHMSADDRAGARQWLDFGKLPMEKPLSDAARFAMEGQFDRAFAVLDQHRDDYPQSHLLDVPAAKFALLAGKEEQALDILERRFADLASGIEPISARNILPAIDLGTARLATGKDGIARELLERVAFYLDAPAALKLPLFAVQRARVHGLLGDKEAAMQALERAYEEGLRMTWAIDLRPQSFLYVDPLEADPAFASLREDARYRALFKRIRTDVASALETYSQ